MTTPVVLGEADSKDLPSDLGRKALTLNQLIRAGLPVPKAVAFSPYLARNSRALLEAAEQLGYPLAVRSSANLEDQSGAAAPGLFDSVLDVHSSEELADAAERVLRSGETPLVQAYLKARGLHQEAVVGIVLQRQVSPSCGHGVLYTRPPGKPEADHAIVELPGSAPLWLDRSTGAVRGDVQSPISAAMLTALWNHALQIEAALEAGNGLDIEWVWGDEGLFFVQARPIVHRSDLATKNSSDTAHLFEFSKGDRERLWRLDATHNPHPLSPAQAGLVREVADIAPYDMRVVGGYLYTAKRPATEASRSKALSQEALEELYAKTLLPKMEQALAGPQRMEMPRLADALSAYRTVFACYTEELAPALAAAGPLSGGNPLSVWLAKTAAGLLSKEELIRQVAPISPAWDVLVPTYGETPERVEHALAIQLSTRTANAAMRESLRESDDLLFYRAQYLVRRALLGIASRWDVGEDVFFMPLEDVRAHEDQPSASPALISAARAGRKAHDEQRSVEMPLAFAGGEPLPTRLPPNAEIWRGVGTGGYVQGTVLRTAGLRDTPQIAQSENTVLVCPTVTPAHALAARGATAVVCEYGEHLGHGAAMARELDIPCIVGCKRAWRELKTGDVVAVHGDAGLVTRLQRAGDAPTRGSGS